MKSYSKIIIFVLILLGSIGAGSATGFFAYKFGTESLQSINLPEVNPSQQLSQNKQLSSQQSTNFEFISEKNILVKVYDYVYYQKKITQGKEKSGQLPLSDSEDSTANSSPENSIQTLKLPLQGEDRGVIIEVADINLEQSSLLLTINLKNNGLEPVKFLYSFLDIKDEKNRSVSSVAEGLPEELPANGQNFSGTVKIPLALLSESQEISLLLTDYPEQQLQLKIPSIPILR